MNVKERIKEYQKVVGMSDYRLEKLMGKCKGWWGNCKNPTGENIQIILDVLPELSAEWLLRGEGQMVRVREEEKLDAFTEAYYRSLLEMKQQRIDSLESEIASLKIKSNIS